MVTVHDLKQFDGLHPLQGVSIGDNTVLHIVATSCSHHLKRRRTCCYEEFVNEVISYMRSMNNISMLTARNKLKETPLHSAAKAGNYRIFSRLMAFIKDEHHDVVESLLTARNIHGETALHEAVRVGDIKIVEDLISLVPGLTGIVDAEGVSPLYLATMLNNFDIVEVFTGKETSLVSWAGPKGQTALHVAVLEHSGITHKLLEWDNSLATKVDDLNSTPLHYAVSAGHIDAVKLLLLHDISAAYMADTNGLYPIHLAAKCGWTGVIKELIEKIPDSDELLDKEGRNFLHTAIKSNRLGRIIFYFRANSTCANPTLLRTLNARDYEGNTPLHFATLHFGSGTTMYHNVTLLISMKMVNLSIMNRDGLTPLDLAITKWDKGFRLFLNVRFNVLRCLLWTGALPSPRRLDLLEHDLNIQNWEDDPKKEVEKAESHTRSLGVISVLIATVTFAAIFTMPGGYIADDHANGGTPVLSRKYAFKAFIVADLLAFVLSMYATSLILYAGLTTMDLHFRIGCLLLSQAVLHVSIKFTVCAFALATYTVLSLVNLPISILVCVVTFGLLPIINPSYCLFLLLALPIVKRLGFKGLFKQPQFLRTTMRRVAESGIWFGYSRVVLGRIIRNLLLFMIIFLLALI